MASLQNKSTHELKASTGTVMSLRATVGSMGTFVCDLAFEAVNQSTVFEVGALSLPAGGSDLVASAIDPTAGFAYFGTQHSPGVVTKVRLSDFTQVGALSLGPDLTSVVINLVAGYAYFGTAWSVPGQVI